MYYEHAVNPCAKYGQHNHKITPKECPVGYKCSKHIEKFNLVVRNDDEEAPESTASGVDYSGSRRRSSNSDQRESLQHRRNNAQVFKRRSDEQGPQHVDTPLKDPAGCSSILQDVATDSVLEEPCTSSRDEDLPIPVIRTSCSQPDGQFTQLVPLQRLRGPQINEGTLESAAAMETTAHSGLCPEYPRSSDLERHLVTEKISFRLRPCYLLIILGVLTVASSLTSALLHAKFSHDIPGGFAIGQYILGVGVFVVGTIAVIHGRNCTCWQNSIRRRVAND